MKPVLKRCKHKAIKVSKLKNLHPATLKHVHTWMKDIYADDKYIMFQRVSEIMTPHEIVRYKLLNMTDLNEYQKFKSRGKELRDYWNSTLPESLHDKEKEANNTTACC